jgi:hypothetical protein
MTSEQFGKLRWVHVEALKHTDIRELFVNGQLTPKQFRDLNSNQRLALEHHDIRELFVTKRLSAEQFRDLNSNQRFALEHHDIRALFVHGQLAPEQFRDLNSSQRFALENNARFFELFRARRVTPEQFARVNYNNTETIANEIEGIRAAVNPNFNGGQSTHTASVHRSVSESATKLKEKYGGEIDTPEKLSQKIQDITQFVSDQYEQNKSSIITRSAKDCVSQITADGYTFKDPGSQVTTRELLALTYIAIQNITDETQKEDAINHWTRGLYEMQRGYNLDESGNDRNPGDRDIQICAGGTFNKFIEKLTGVVPECKIIFMTHETATAKFVALTKEAVINYLNDLSKKSSAEDFKLVLTKLRTGVQNSQGIGQEIWVQIKADIKKTLFDEFKSLYNNDENDPRLSALIDAGDDFNELSLDIDLNPANFADNFSAGLFGLSSDTRSATSSTASNQPKSNIGSAP